MGKVIRFPQHKLMSNDPLKQEFVNRGIYDHVRDVPDVLVKMIIDYWQEIFDTGYDVGHTDALSRFLKSKNRLPSTKVKELVKVNLLEPLIAKAQNEHQPPRTYRAKWEVFYIIKEGWKLKKSVSREEDS